MVKIVSEHKESNYSSPDCKVINLCLQQCIFEGSGGEEEEEYDASSIDDREPGIDIVI